MKVWSSTAFAGVLMVVFATSPALSAQLATQRGFSQVPDTPVCEIHVWQSNDYRSTVSYPYLPGNTALQSAHDSKHPNSVVRQIEYELRSETLGGLVGSVPWSTYIHHPVKVIVEHDIVDKQKIKVIRSGNSRNSTSFAHCYYELYIGQQSFVKSYATGLFTKFTLRMFNANTHSTTDATAFSKTKHFPAKDAASVQLANQAIRDAFVSNVGQFLSFRLGKRAAN